VVEAVKSGGLVVVRWDPDERVEVSKQILRLATLWMRLQKKVDVESRWREAAE
jgi:hypothetical protein